MLGLMITKSFVITGCISSMWSFARLSLGVCSQVSLCFALQSRLQYLAAQLRWDPNTDLGVTETSTLFFAYLFSYFLGMFQG